MKLSPFTAFVLGVNVGAVITVIIFIIAFFVTG